MSWGFVKKLSTYGIAQRIFFLDFPLFFLVIEALVSMVLVYCFQFSKQSLFQIFFAFSLTVLSVRKFLKRNNFI